MHYAELFVWMLLGHLVGDYILQNGWMALTKGGKGLKADLACSVHVLLYTLAVVGSIWYGYQWGMSSHQLGWLTFWIAVPHWIIDRFCLFGKFMEWKNGQHPFRLLEGTQLIGTNYSGNLVEATPDFKRKMYDVAFAAPVYIVTDNTAHLVMMWLAIRAIL